MSARGLVLFFLAASIHAGPPKGLIDSANARVAAISDTIALGQYATMTIDETRDSEGALPSLRFYYSGERLVAVIATAGHETWSNEFQFYYYPDGKTMKYVKVAKGRPDNPPRQGIIYGQDGKVIWKNTETPALDGQILRGLFVEIKNAGRSLSQY